MRKILLTKGKAALVDNKNYHWLNQWKWGAYKDKHNYYAMRRVWDKIKKKYYTILMHRLIMNTPNTLECDHKDHNGLNCLERNLRNCTHAENQKNRRASGKSKYLGVTFQNKKYKEKEYTYIVATIKIKNKIKYLGSFKTEKEAAIAYDKAASYFHKEFANLNFKIK